MIRNNRSGLLLAAFLTGLFLLAGTGAPSYATAQTFSDIEGHWAASAITEWASYGVVSGDGTTFRPDDTLTRAELAVILGKLMGYRQAAENTFSDLNDHAWYAQAVLKANAAGVLYGDNNGNVEPEGNVTREQAAVMLARAFAVEEKSGSDTAFADADRISTWAANEVYAMEQAGWVSGMGNGRFSPRTFVTRAQIVSMIDKAVSAYYNTAGTYSEKISPADEGAKCLVLVCTDGVVLKNAVIDGDLLIAEGVGEGNFSLDGTSVSGKMTIRGGGADSIHILNGASVGGKVTIERSEGVVRIVSDGVVVAELESDTEVILEGDFGEVVLGEGASVEIRGTVTSLTLAGKAEVSIEEGASVGTLILKETAEGSAVEVAGTVTTVTNETKETEITQAAAVAEEEEISGGGGGGGGGGSSGGGSSDPVTAESAAALSTAKTAAAALTQSHYTTASWASLATALAMGESTNTTATAKTAAINAAITGLVLKDTVEALGTVSAVTTGVYNITFSKTRIEQKFPGIETSETLTVTISGSEEGVYTATYITALSCWLVYNVQGATAAEIAAGTVARTI